MDSRNLTIGDLIGILSQPDYAEYKVRLGDGFEIDSLYIAHGVYWLVGNWHGVPGRVYAGTDKSYRLTVLYQ